MPTAMAPPAIGPARYAHHEVQSPFTRAGPSDRAGFIDAPLTGLPRSADWSYQPHFPPLELPGTPVRGAPQHLSHDVMVA
jgi:hypothetical protein